MEQVLIGDPAGMIPNELVPRLPEIEMKRVEWDHIPSDEEMIEPAVDGWSMVKFALHGRQSVYGYYERSTGPLSGYGPAMTEPKAVHASQSELEAAARLFSGRDPGASFEEAMESDPGRIQKLVDEVRKDFKGKNTPNVDDPKSVMEKADEDPVGGAQGHEA